MSLLVKKNVAICGVLAWIQLIATSSRCSSFVVVPSPLLRNNKQYLIKKRSHSVVLNGWSGQAEFHNLNGKRQVDFCEFSFLQTQEINLSSPRLWLESQPDGAYTVIRCDFTIYNPSDERTWNIWGKEFHLSRLERSYDALLNSQRIDIDSQKGIIEGQRCDNIQSDCNLIIDYLLKEALNEMARCSNFISPQTCMITLLCYPDNTHIRRLLGHICFADVPTSIPSPVTISIANGFNLPDRTPRPEAKLSSWCRERRVIENMYKYDHIAEVILVRQHTAAENNTTLLLEGLTSNFFVIRDDNVLQTAGEHILPGYAREMVLHQARSVVGLEIELESPRMEDCASWKSVFITSSVRLMVPVDKVVVAVVGKNETLKTIWSSASSNHPLFRKLFESVSSAGG